MGSEMCIRDRPRAHEGSVRDDLRARLLLDLCDGLVEGTAHVSFVQTERVGTTCAALARVMRRHLHSSCRKYSCSGWRYSFIIHYALSSFKPMPSAQPCPLARMSQLHLPVFNPPSFHIKRSQSDSAPSSPFAFASRPPTVSPPQSRCYTASRPSHPSLLRTAHRRHQGFSHPSFSEQCQAASRGL